MPGDHLAKEARGETMSMMSWIPGRGLQRARRSVGLRTGLSRPRPRRAKPRRGAGTRLAAIVTLIAFGIGGCRTKPEVARFEVAPWSWGGRTGQKLTSEHFCVYTTVENPELVRTFPVLLERAYQEHVLRMPSLRPKTAKMETFVFATRREWENYTREAYLDSYAVYRFIRSGGFTEGGHAVLFHTTPAATLATVAHESWHQYVETSTGVTLPAWLNEGLACYHESYDFTQTPPQPIPLRNTFRLEHLRRALTAGPLFSLRELLETEPGEVLSRDDASLTQTYYAGVWSLVAFLCHGQGGRYAKAFDRMMTDAAQGVLTLRVRASLITEGAAAHAGFGHAVFVFYFGGVSEAMEQAYRDYLHSLAGLQTVPDAEAVRERPPAPEDPSDTPEKSAADDPGSPAS